MNKPHDNLIAYYDEAEEWCNKVVNGHDMLFDVDIFDVEMMKACTKFKFPTEVRIQNKNTTVLDSIKVSLQSHSLILDLLHKKSFNSFLRNIHLKKVKKQTHIIKSKLDHQIIPDYTQGRSIVSLAKKYNFPPALLSRSIIEKVTTLQKKKISEAMKNPMDKLNSSSVVKQEHRISEASASSSSSSADAKVYDPFSGEEIILSCGSDSNSGTSNMTRLAKEVQEAISLDPLYGPRSDRERQIIGTEYEIILEQTLRSMSEYNNINLTI